MVSLAPIQPRTVLLARVLGPYLILAALAMAVRSSDMDALASGFSASAVWPWVTGALVLPLGLVIIALHPYWRGTAAVIVSVLGWLTAIKGLALMAFPHAYLAVGQHIVNSTPWWPIVLAVLLAVGFYLSIVGWLPAGTPATPAANRGRTDPEQRDLPHAA